MEIQKEEAAAISPHDLTMPNGCRAEADRIAELCRQNGQSADQEIAAWADWQVEANMMEKAIDSDYAAFLHHKAQDDHYSGFKAEPPDFLFPFQKELFEWAIRKGKAAIFADCGLGKTPMQLAWADAVARRENKPVLLLTPLGVTSQAVEEAAKFGLEARRSRDGKVYKPITVTNYEQLHRFDPNDFSGAVCDESSAIKAFSGKRRAEVTHFMRKRPYRSLWTATAAPNDYIELGTSSEALGELGYVDMLNRFFKNDQNTTDTKGRMYGAQRGWRFKGHAEEAFWSWICSWARAIRKPSDLGFSDDGFRLPPLIENEHIVNSRTLPPGALFEMPAKNWREELEERRRTVTERCEKAAELVQHSQPAVIWCHRNDEGELLAKLLPDFIEVAGRHTDEEKEEAFAAFRRGQSRGIITKPKIGAWGLNWQHCGHVVTFASHSYEQYYQSVRRCWRFGQQHKVVVDLVATEGERGIKDNLARKSQQAARMFERLVAHMGDALQISRTTTFDHPVEVPSWL